MSNHHSQKSINLHHDQVNAGQAKRQQRQDARLQAYLTGWFQARFEYWWIQFAVAFCFGYTMIATAAYLRHLL